MFFKSLKGVTLSFIPVGIALNVIMGQIVTLIKLPLYLDSIGTVLVAILCGPLAGVITGIVACLIQGALFNPIIAFYSITAATIGATAGILANRGFFLKWYKVILGGIIQAIIAAVVSAPITAYVFGGITLAGTDLIVAYFRATGRVLIESVFLAGLASEPVDKTLTYIFAFLIAQRLPHTLVGRFPREENVISSK